jgi:hypothetical protein
MVSNVETKSSLKLSSLCIDRRGEYLSTEFNNYYKQTGVWRQLMATRTPQQNGLANGKNIHLCETIRTLLFGANLLATFGRKRLK